MKLALKNAAQRCRARLRANASGEFASRAGGFDASLKHGFWLRGFGFRAASTAMQPMQDSIIGWAESSPATIMR
jgi:hypothetical protein